VDYAPDVVWQLDEKYTSQYFVDIAFSLLVYSFFLSAIHAKILFIDPVFLNIK
jgi:hypothetical protein